MMETDHGFKDADDSEFQLMTYEPRILDSVPSARETSEQWGEHHGWDTSTHVESGMNFANRGYENVAGETESLAEHETLEKVWSWSVETCSRIWEKLEPVVMEYMPEDRNPFWVGGVLLLVFFVMIAGLRAGFKQNGAVKNVKAEVAKVVDLPPINAPHVKLPDGRRVAYREQGVSQQFARHTILVVHGLPSSRLAGIPGLKSRLLEDFGVRLIAYDRPGFGESDTHSRRSLRASAQDMADIAKALEVEDKFWVVGYSTGGIHAWAAMKYIPSRLAGVGLFAPGGNFYAPNMTKQESSEIWRSLTFRQKLLYRVARWAPSALAYFCRRMFFENADKLQNDFLVTIGKDRVLMQQEMFLKALMRDVEESTRQGNVAAIAQEILIQVRPWGFHLSDFRVRKKLPNSGLLHRLRNFWKEEETGWEGFSAPIHIWQGTEDRIVPFGINEFAVRMVPQAVLHRLEGEGHFSYFWFCDKCHRNIFLTLFKEPEGVKVPVPEQPTSVGLETLYEAYEQTQKG
eukprot:c19795_g1_i1 orf=289-1833(+)